LEISLYEYVPSAEQAAEVSDEWVNAVFLPLSSFHSHYSRMVSLSSYFQRPEINTAVERIGLAILRV
jgi:hypothetical protein